MRCKEDTVLLLGSAGPGYGIELLNTAYLPMLRQPSAFSSSMIRAISSSVTNE